MEYQTRSCLLGVDLRSFTILKYGLLSFASNLIIICFTLNSFY
ncbi:hypothetical protein A1OE_502 [Candidatus Endolissoclinum faulkneri L2]|uniref:Uncharacterized protein n=1 Tax=Candidatus Endolissoclinum faulkneri L2 TaxID=1193729 RepID=K7YGG5_9PROT|nr:hypothetical protein A1OE_502 [Candidatus Endolissoclinum faulkneri L2]